MTRAEPHFFEALLIFLHAGFSYPFTLFYKKECPIVTPDFIDNSRLLQSVSCQHRTLCQICSSLTYGNHITLLRDFLCNLLTDIGSVQDRILAVFRLIIIKAVARLIGFSALLWCSWIIKQRIIPFLSSINQFLPRRCTGITLFSIPPIKTALLELIMSLGRHRQCN